MVEVAEHLHFAVHGQEQQAGEAGGRHAAARFRRVAQRRLDEAGVGIGGEVDAGALHDVAHGALRRFDAAGFADRAAVGAIVDHRALRERAELLDDGDRFRERMEQLEIVAVVAGKACLVEPGLPVLAQQQIAAADRQVHRFAQARLDEILHRSVIAQVDEHDGIAVLDAVEPEMRDKLLREPGRARRDLRDDGGLADMGGEFGLGQSGRAAWPRRGRTAGGARESRSIRCEARAAHSARWRPWSVMPACAAVSRLISTMAMRAASPG